MIAPEVVDFRAREGVAGGFIKEEHAQFARFPTRVGHDRPTIVRDRNGPAGVNNLKIDSYARADFELVPHPKPSARGARATLRDSIIDFRFEVRAFDRRELLSLCGDKNGSRQDQG